MLITQVTVDVVTGQSEGAGTDGDVYLGLGGREFHLDVEEQDDFEAGDDIRYVLGEGANVASPDRNDPRRHVPITLERLDQHPVYVAFRPASHNDDWEVTQVLVTVHSEGSVRRYGALLEMGQRLWLGRRSGFTCALEKL